MSVRDPILPPRFERLNPNAQRIAVEAAGVLNRLSIAITTGNPSKEAVVQALRTLNDYIEHYWKVLETEDAVAAGLALDEELQRGR